MYVKTSPYPTFSLLLLFFQDCWEGICCLQMGYRRLPIELLDLEQPLMVVADDQTDIPLDRNLGSVTLGCGDKLDFVYLELN